MLVKVSFTFLANIVSYNIKTANVFNMATECTEQTNKHFSLVSETMNCSDLNIHWNYIIQNDVTLCIMAQKGSQANYLCHMIILLDGSIFINIKM